MTEMYWADKWRLCSDYLFSGRYIQGGQGVEDIERLGFKWDITKILIFMLIIAPSESTQGRKVKTRELRWADPCQWNLTCSGGVRPVRDSRGAFLTKCVNLVNLPPVRLNWDNVILFSILLSEDIWLQLRHRKFFKYILWHIFHIEILELVNWDYFN